MPEQPEEKVAIIDGSNVAYSGGDSAHLANILAMRDKLTEEGFTSYILADAALRHQIDDKTRFEQMVDEGEIRQAPAGTDADYFILAFARELNARVVSNDRYRDRQDAFPEARDSVIRYMILDGEVVLEHRTKRRD